MIRFPLESTASVSPDPMLIVTVPPLNSAVGVVILDFWPALMPSSEASMVTVPSLIWIQVPSIPSLEEVEMVPPSIWAMVVAWMASSPASMVSVPPPI